jgi:hypothetical protein
MYVNVCEAKVVSQPTGERPGVSDWQVQFDKLEVRDIYFVHDFGGNGIA